jgi:hypothetical protein
MLVIGGNMLMGTHRGTSFFLAGAVAIVALLAGREGAFAAPPLIDFEGVGGAGIVPGAYRVNPPKEGDFMGKPAVALWSMIGGESNIYTQGFAFSFLKMFEAGYMLEIADFRRLRRQIRRDSGGDLDVGRPYIYLHNLHLKTLLLEEQELLPAFAITLEYKYNYTIDEMNKNIGNALDSVGYDDNDALDIDFSISKTIQGVLFRPVMINGNLRLTRGHYCGFLGFSSSYTANGELSAILLLHPNFVMGAEVRQQNDELDPLPLEGYTMAEDTFWNVHAGYFPNERASFAIAFCRYGKVVNKDVNYLVLNFKYDF